jgi:predicted molibdopterin-dependent oxidoreductase YjgC
MNYRHPSQVMAEIAQVVPAYRGVSYARLERGGLIVPVEEIGSEGTPILGAPETHAVTYDTSLSPAFVDRL